MIRINFHYPGGNKGWSRSSGSLPFPPRVDDLVSYGGSEYRVKTVVWYPWGEDNGIDPFVYVVVTNV